MAIWEYKDLLFYPIKKDNKNKFLLLLIKFDSEKIKEINRILKLQLSELSKFLELPGPKVVILILLTVRSNLLRTHKLSPYMLLKGCLMHLGISFPVPEFTLLQFNVTEYFRRLMKYL